MTQKLKNNSITGKRCFLLLNIRQLQTKIHQPKMVLVTECLVFTREVATVWAAIVKSHCQIIFKNLLNRWERKEGDCIGLNFD